MVDGRPDRAAEVKLEKREDERGEARGRERRERRSERTRERTREEQRGEERSAHGLGWCREKLCVVDLAGDWVLPPPGRPFLQHVLRGGEQYVLLHVEGGRQQLGLRAASRLAAQVRWQNLG